MAENANGLTTEQLLIGLGQAVMSIGNKIETLGEKMDSIYTVLADDIAPVLKKTESGGAGETASMDLTPLLDKVDEFKSILEKQTPAGESGESGDPQFLAAVSDKLQAIENILSGEILPAIKESRVHEDAAQIDLSPVLEKIDAVTTAIGEIEVISELKPVIDGLSASFEKLPSEMTDKLKELKKEDTSNPMEKVELKLTEVHGKLEEILKVSQDKEFVETLSSGLSQVKEQLVSSGEQVLDVVKTVPDKIENMGKDLSESMKTLSETTGEMLDKTEKNITQSNESLGEIKKELEKGLKLNTDMTGQMVDITSKFADKAEEDRIHDLNTRAVTHFNHGEFSEAEALWSQALNLSPENSELLCNTAHLKAAMEEMEEAERLFRKALEISPDMEPAVSGLGMLMVSTGRADETIEFLKNVLVNGEPSVRTTIAYTRALSEMDRHDEAVELLETSLRAAPGNHDLLEELAKYGHEEKS